MPEILDLDAQRKCAYSLCECPVSSVEAYCSDYCSAAENARELEVQRDCKHRACLLD